MVHENNVNFPLSPPRPRLTATWCFVIFILLASYQQNFRLKNVEFAVEMAIFQLGFQRFLNIIRAWELFNFLFKYRKKLHESSLFLENDKKSDFFFIFKGKSHESSQTAWIFEKMTKTAKRAGCLKNTSNYPNRFQFCF